MQKLRKETVMPVEHLEETKKPVCFYGDVSSPVFPVLRSILQFDCGMWSEVCASTR